MPARSSLSQRPRTPKQALSSNRGVGSWSGPLPGLPAGVASPAIMRGCLRAARPLSKSLPAGSCSRTWLLRSPKLYQADTLLEKYFCLCNDFLLEYQRYANKNIIKILYTRLLIDHKVLTDPDIVL